MTLITSVRLGLNEAYVCHQDTEMWGTMLFFTEIDKYGECDYSVSLFSDVYKPYNIVPLLEILNKDDLVNKVIQLLLAN